ncbi:multiprotein bridging factor [Mitosporidium daphniae]|uniref:Multiprotein bridging factor n=1 Tax=Mitosporidium daphniae TaxID=1485682 RepID=A0A098VWT2_9MICR|nr:multiprotein bridging factor [Mitosporidium daphniae]KGG52221.1 multiprotein bridging factor [Mitosporidium daphniae]|eukprot:XP_013238686.1 multiprotein bridging factor [Mitosporidium daphniae]
MDTSDWEKVTVLRKKKLPPQHSTKAVNEALAKGSPVEISKRYNAGTNRPSASTPSAEQRHIAESDEIILPRTISHDVGMCYFTSVLYLVFLLLRCSEKTRF